MARGSWLGAKYRAVEDRLEGWPDTTLTVVLVIAGLVIIALALFSRSRTLKVGLAAYVLLP